MNNMVDAFKLFWALEMIGNTISIYVIIVILKA